MRWFGWSTERVQDDPLVTTADIPRLTGANRTSIYRLRSEGRLPPPDEVTSSEEPLWRASTIRSWWVGDMRKAWSHDASLPRYHRQFEPLGEPALLHEILLPPPEGSAGGTQRPIHVRVFRGQDGLAPVVVVGLPATDTHSWPAGPDRMSTGMYLHTEASMPRDLDLTDVDTAWIHYRPDGIEPRDVSCLDYRTALWDVTGYNRPRGARFGVITPADLHRLIGMPLEVYSPSTYHARVVEHRMRSTGTVPEVVDPKGVWTLVCHLRAIDEALESEDPTLGQAGRVAASVLAGEILVRAEGYEYQRASAKDREPHSVHLDPLFRAAVTPVAFSLAARDHALVRAHSERDAQDAAQDPDAPAHLDELDRLLNEWPGLSELGLRAALNAGRQQLAEAVRRVDPDSRRQLRSPKVVELYRRGPTDAYVASLAQYGRWDHWTSGSIASRALDQVPDHLRRRAFALLDAFSTDMRRDVALLHDGVDDLLVMTFTELGCPPDPYGLFPHGTADVAMVRMEWPQAVPLSFDPTLARSRLLSPAASGGCRPVYLSRDGRLRPLPGAGDVAWGVSGTDTLTPAVLEYFGIEEADDALWQWLRVVLTAGGPEALDVDLGPVIQRLGLS